MGPGSRVRRKRNPDNNIGTIIEVDAWNCAKIKWDIPTVNSFTKAVTQHSTINLKNLIDLDPKPIEAAKAEPEQKPFDLFNQQ